MRVLRVTFVAISILFSFTAFAGFAIDLEVVVDVDNNSAQGNMWAARSSEDSSQLIGCGRNIGNFGPPFDNYGFCQANDANDVFVGCFIFDPEMLEVLSSINSYSFVRFEHDGVVVIPENPNFYTCTALSVSTQSRYLPLIGEKKDKKVE